ncbi:MULTISPECIES: ester cyclase [unclassified Streptomyces]|uniref:ester cyclase n=1 Tax=unclassified Streptomyces TaxID=2593676 RepID=UPI002E0F1F76|nr:MULTISPECIES: ester cyclase [unclassified Streptomyces]WSR27639.1 ester cyclase [Streptomyces sp. NBC_01205]
MTFVQIVDYETSKPDAVNEVIDRYLAKTKGKRTVSHTVVGRDRESDTHFVDVVEFPSYEAAMKNSHLPETDKMFQEMMALCDGMPRFTNLDVIRDEHLNTLLANRMYDDVAMKGDMSVVDEIFAADYRDHDISNPVDKMGRDGIREDVGMWRSAFDFTFTRDAQMAQDDYVTTMWTWTGKHKGEFMGISPTGKTCTMTGTTVFRCEDGMIKEGWWHYDAMRLMRELGAM